MKSILDQLLEEAQAGFDVQDNEELEAALAATLPAHFNQNATRRSQAGNGHPGQHLHFASISQADDLVAVFEESLNGHKEDVDQTVEENLVSSSNLEWGQCYLCEVDGSSATAKFGGGGSHDVPTVCSSGEVTRKGRGFWRVTFESILSSLSRLTRVSKDSFRSQGKGIGQGGFFSVDSWRTITLNCLQAGLAKYAVQEKGIAGIELGQNWNDRFLKMTLPVDMNELMRSAELVWIQPGILIVMEMSLKETTVSGDRVTLLEEVIMDEKAKSFGLL
eukprot:768617-Hanusia_phi.AAC.4